MSNEKWILYNNVEQKRSWDKWNEPSPTTSKPSLHPKKVMMLCIWWNWKGVLYYELLLESQRINSNRYCSQLDWLKAVLNEKCIELVKRKYVIFHQDNTRPHVSLMTRQEKMLQLRREVWIHPLYSPNIIPMDFHLFRSSQNSLNGKKCYSLEDCKGYLEQFFAQKKLKIGEKMELWSHLKNGRRYWNKMVNMLSKKISCWKLNMCILFLL